MGSLGFHRHIAELRIARSALDASLETPRSFMTTTASGRVEMWRGCCRPNISVSASFVWRCLSGSTVTPFPHPAHRTGRADLPHPALGQDLTRLLSRATPSAVSEPFAEFIGCPISEGLLHVLRLSCTEVPSLHRRYPASAILRTSPPPHDALP